MVTLKDIAEKANVSIATVSRVLNNKAGSIGISEKTRQRVLQVARELDYQPNRLARSLRMGKTLKHILFIYVIGSQDDFFLHPFYHHMLHGVQLEAAKQGYYLSYVGLNAETQDAVLNLIDGEASGIISWGKIPDEVAERIASQRLPLIAIEPYREFKDIDYGSIYVDNDLAIKQALEFLVTCGHRRIGFLSEAGPELAQFEERRVAFEKWISHYGLEIFPTQQLLVGSTPEPSVYWRGDLSGLKAWADAPTAQRPTAVITSNDLAAISVVRHLKRLGWQIPRDLSVVGIDDIALSVFNEPPLTTVRIPQEEIGILAVSLLDEILRNGCLDRVEHRVKTKLVVRETVKDLNVGGLADADQ